MESFHIYFRKQDGECPNIEVCINTGANCEKPWYILKIDVGSVIAAEFVALELNRKLRDLMVHIRQNAYERGWKDAKRKRIKSDLFPSMCQITWFDKP